MNWEPITTAPKQGYCLAYDPCLTSAFPITWNARKNAFMAPDGFGDETPTHWQPLPPLEDWAPIETAPKGCYLLGFDPILKRPFVMIWNVPGQVFASSTGSGNEKAMFWLPLPEVPRTTPQHLRAA